VTGPVHEFSAKAYASSRKGRSLAPAEAVELYRLRDLDLAKLTAQEVITAEDIHGLDRLGRFRVADSLFHKCVPAAVDALLNDPHHGVRSTASISHSLMSSGASNPS
jgi:hypothetical protein